MSWWMYETTYASDYQWHNKATRRRPASLSGIDIFTCITVQLKLKGQWHEKVGEMWVRGDSLGTN
jgi:hypothetical protein